MFTVKSVGLLCHISFHLTPNFQSCWQIVGTVAYDLVGNILLDMLEFSSSSN